MAKSKYYVAYGSNMNTGQMQWRCPKAVLLGDARMHGWALRFRGVATIERQKGGLVPVLVWRITPEDEKALDRYEGWPHLYRKEIVRLYLDMKQIRAMVYIMNEDGHPYCAPEKSYYDTILEGYRSAGLNVDILSHAVMVSERYSRSEKGDSDDDRESEGTDTEGA